MISRGYCLKKFIESESKSICELSNLRFKKYQRRVRKIQKSSLELILAARETQLIFSKFKIPPISFKETIERASENLDLVYLTNNQRAIVDEITEEMASMILFNDFIIRGFLWRAIKKWQKIHQKPIALVSRMNRIEQLQIGIEILDHSRLYMSRAIYIPNKKMKKQFLDEVFRQITEYYEELLSVQAFLDNPDNEEILLDYEIENWLDENKSLFLLPK